MNKKKIVVVLVIIGFLCTGFSMLSNVSNSNASNIKSDSALSIANLNIYQSPIQYNVKNISIDGLPVVSDFSMAHNSSRVYYTAFISSSNGYLYCINLSSGNINSLQVFSNTYLGSLLAYNNSNTFNYIIEIITSGYNSQFSYQLYNIHNKTICQAGTYIWPIYSINYLGSKNILSASKDGLYLNLQLTMRYHF